MPIPSPTPRAAGGTVTPPVGHVVLWDASKARRRLRALRALLTGAVGFGAVFFVFLASSLAFAGPILLVVPIGATAWFSFQLHQINKLLARSTNVEVDNGRMRAGFALHPTMEGWRPLSDIQLVALDPAPDVVEVAEQLMARLPGPAARKAGWRRKVETWASIGGLLIISKDEVLYSHNRGSTARALETHWRASQPQ
jgi:hypothetical protein